MRFQVDENRERLIEKIDEIALAMIDKITEHEANLSERPKRETFSNSIS
jgi:hypothetical protein